MSKEWKCKDCCCFETDACHYPAMKENYVACEHLVVDYDEAHQQGREDAIDEFVEKYIYPLVDEYDIDVWKDINYIKLADMWVTLVELHGANSESIIEALIEQMKGEEECDLIEYIVMRDCPSGCHYAKEHECLKYKNCDECAKYHIAEHDAKVRADAIEEFKQKIIKYSGEHYIDCDGYFGCNTELVFRVDEWFDDIISRRFPNGT